MIFFYFFLQKHLKNFFNTFTQQVYIFNLLKSDIYKDMYNIIKYLYFKQILLI